MSHTVSLPQERLHYEPNQGSTTKGRSFNFDVCYQLRRNSTDMLKNGFFGKNVLSVLGYKSRAQIVKVQLTPKIFFAEIIRLVSWSNVTQKFFELVKSSNFYAPSKYVKMPPFWFATEFNGAWVEGRM